MKNPHRASEGAGKTQRAAVTAIIAPGTLCPNAALCRRWSADDGGSYCRCCWRDFTDPKPLRIAEGRA